MSNKWDSKKYSFAIIFEIIMVGLLIAEFCTPKQDVFSDESTWLIILGMIIGFAVYMFGQSLIDAIKEIASEVAVKWLEKKS